MNYDDREPPPNQEDDLLWRQLKTLPAFRALLRSVEARFYHQLALDGPILDVGCGDGHFAQMAFDDQLTAGIDPWVGPLKKAYGQDIYQDAIQGLGDSMPFSDGTFVTAISNSVLEHIPDVQPVLNEVNRVLRQHGRFVLTMPNDQFTAMLGGALWLEGLGLGRFANTYRRYFNKISRHSHTDSASVWADRLAESGFIVERWQNYFSAEALHALELGHAQGLPSAILHFLTGHWILAPWRSNLQLTEQWLRPYYEETAPESGTMTLIVARKVATRPVTASLPPASILTSQSLNDEQTADVAAEFSAGIAAQGREKLHEEGSISDNAIPGENLDSEIASPGAGAVQFPINVSRRLWYLLPSIILVFVADRLTGTSTGALETIIGLFIWISAIASAVYALSNKAPNRNDLRISVSVRGWELISILAIFTVSLALRSVLLTSHPYILSGSEASIGLDAGAVLNGGLRDPFAAAWLSNPTLPAFLMAIPMKFLGQTILGIRILSPLIGALTVVATYLVGRMFWGSLAGFVAAILLAGSHVHIHYSRLGLSNIWDSLIMLLAVGLIYLAWTRKKRSLWLAAGIIIGLSAYFYTSSHLMPAILLGFGFYLISRPVELRNNRSHLLAAGTVALIVSFPQLLFYLSFPEVFFDRYQALGIFQNDWLLEQAAHTGDSVISLLGKQIAAGLLAFNVGVDLSNSYNPGIPLLFMIPSLLLGLGLGLAFLRVKRSTNALLVLVFLGTVLVAGVMLIDPPSSHRLVIAMPVIYLLIASSLLWLGNRLTRIINISQRYVTVAVIGIALFVSISDISFYYGRYRLEGNFGDRNTEIAHQMSDYLNTLEGEWEGFFIAPPSMYVSFPTFSYLVQDWQEDIQMSDIAEGDNPPIADGDRNNVFIYLPERIHELDELEEGYPSSRLLTFSGIKADPLFYALEIPAVNSQ